MICNIKEEPKGESYRKLIKYALMKSDIVMFVYRKDRYIKGANCETIKKMSEILNKETSDIESNYLNYIENKYEELYENIQYILGNQMNLVNIIYKQKKNDINKIIKEQIINNVKNEIECKNNLLIQEKNINDLKEELKKYLVKERHDSKWVGNEVILENNKIQNAKYNDKNIYDICFYKVCERIERFLLESVDSLYSFNPPLLPEDISFLKKGYCWFNTVSHEEVASMDIENLEEYNYLLNIGIKIEKYDDNFRDQKEFYEKFDNI